MNSSYIDVYVFFVFAPAPLERYQIQQAQTEFQHNNGQIRLVLRWSVLCSDRLLARSWTTILFYIFVVLVVRC